MRAVATRRFKDKKTGAYREKGEEFTCSAERFAEINSTEFGVLAEEVAEKPKTRPRKAPAKKA